jgi:hypothetical protein
VPELRSIRILLRTDRIAVGALITVPRIISSRITRYRATRAACCGITRAARADTCDRVCRARAALVAAAVDTSGMHATSGKATTASVKAAASTSEPAAAPTSERVIRDEAGAD